MVDLPAYFFLWMGLLERVPFFFNLKRKINKNGSTHKLYAGTEDKFEIFKKKLPQETFLYVEKAIVLRKIIAFENIIIWIFS